MGRTSDARQRLVDTAMDLMRRRGYAAIGVADICAQAGVQKGSFYHFFESKQALAVEVISEYWACQREEWQAILGPGDGATTMSAISDLFRAQVEAQRVDLQQSGRVHGCLLGNFALELSSQDEVVQQRLVEVFGEQLTLLADALTAASTVGGGDPDRDMRGLARALLAQLEGMIMFAKVSNDADVLGALWPSMQQLIEAKPSA